MLLCHVLVYAHIYIYDIVVDVGRTLRDISNNFRSTRVLIIEHRKCPPERLDARCICVYSLERLSCMRISIMMCAVYYYAVVGTFGAIMHVRSLCKVMWCSIYTYIHEKRFMTMMAIKRFKNWMDWLYMYNDDVDSKSYLIDLIDL